MREHPVFFLQHPALFGQEYDFYFPVFTFYFVFYPFIVCSCMPHTFYYFLNISHINAMRVIIWITIAAVCIAADLHVEMCDAGAGETQDVLQQQRRSENHNGKTMASAYK